MTTKQNNMNIVWESLNISVFGTRPSIRTFHGAAILGQQLVIAAGRNMTKRLNDTYALDLSDLAPGGLDTKMAIQATADLQNNLPTPEHVSKLRLVFFFEWTDNTFFCLYLFGIHVC